MTILLLHARGLQKGTIPTPHIPGAEGTSCVLPENARPCALMHTRIARCCILASVTELAYRVPALCRALWLQIFPQAWGAIGARERVQLSAAASSVAATAAGASEPDVRTGGR